MSTDEQTVSNRGFVQVPKELIESNIPDYAFRLLLRLEASASRNPLVWMSNKTLAGNLNKGTRAINNGLKWLTENGWIKGIYTKKKVRLAIVMVKRILPVPDRPAVESQETYDKIKDILLKRYLKYNGVTGVRIIDQSTMAQICKLCTQKSAIELDALELDSEESEPGLVARRSVGTTITLDQRLKTKLAKQAHQAKTTLGVNDTEAKARLHELLVEITNEPTKSKAIRLVDKTARFLTEQLMDEEWHKQYCVYLWDVWHCGFNTEEKANRQNRTIEHFEKAFATNLRDMPSGKVRETPGQYFFGCLNTYLPNNGLEEETESPYVSDGPNRERFTGDACSDPDDDQ